MMDQASYERLEKDVARVKDDISDLAEQITDALNTIAGSARKQARSGYKQARANVDQVAADLSDHGSAILDAAISADETLEDVIAERPLATVGLALGLGFLIGVTWRR